MNLLPLSKAISFGSCFIVNKDEAFSVHQLKLTSVQVCPIEGESENEINFSVGQVHLWRTEGQFKSDNLYTINKVSSVLTFNCDSTQKFRIFAFH